jgi:ribosomal protein L11 methyltransferase
MYDGLGFYLCLMQYLKLTFSDVSQEQQEIIIAQLNNQGFLGFEQKESHLLAFADQKEIDANTFRESVVGFSFSEELIPEVNWNEKWERDFEPIILENQVAIRAHFHEAITSVKHEIVITPKMSFGTGHHATTQLMLERMSEIDFNAKKVFDFGTGTGVLAVYAEILGAQKIIANDIDPWSQENSIENVGRNHCKNIEVRIGGIEVVVEEEFDCILANINLNVLRESMTILFQKLRKKNSHLLISGIMKKDKENIIKIIEVYSTDYHVFEKNAWLCLHIFHS